MRNRRALSLDGDGRRKFATACELAAKKRKRHGRAARANRAPNRARQNFKNRPLSFERIHHS
jgi:hypothetical protein